MMHNDSFQKSNFKVDFKEVGVYFKQFGRGKTEHKAVQSISIRRKEQKSGKFIPQKSIKA